MNSNQLRLMAASTGALLLVAASYRTQTPRVMSDTANAFLASLTAEQKGKAVFAFEDDERKNWHFIPKVRKGLPLKQMSHEQRHLAHALLSAGVSQQGYQKAMSIMSLEDILRQLEKDTTGRRDPEQYFFSIFGTPSEGGTWAYRVEGHHLALNWTIAKNRVASSPMFFGTNPAEIKEGPRKGLRVLGREEDLGRDLRVALTAEQVKTAVVAEVAYKDIFTMADRVAALKGQPNGLSAAKMTGKQREMLAALLDEYVSNVPEQAAATRAAQVKAAGTNLYFAWAGTAAKGEGHYYRVQGPTFLVEYDNTQNNNNHVHSVWRDYAGDFGVDLLGDHVKANHSKE